MKRSFAIGVAVGLVVATLVDDWRIQLLVGVPLTIALIRAIVRPGRTR